MMNIKRKISVVMTAIFTTFMILNGVQASAINNTGSLKSQISVVTKYVTVAETYVKPKVFTVKWAQVSVNSAKNQINNLTSKTYRNLFMKRLNAVQIKINARIKVLAALNAATAENAQLLKATTTKVISLEASAKSNLTVAVNLVAAEKLILPATSEVAKLANGADKAALQKRITIASTKITNARATFNGAVAATHNVTTLSAVILSAQALQTGAIEGSEDGNYAIGSKEILESAITTGQAIVTNAAVTSQSAIDIAVTTLKAAVASFNSGLVVTHDVTALSASILSAQGIYSGAIEGSAAGNYAVGSKDTLQAAIIAAQTIVTNATNTSQGDINTALAELNTAIATFNAGVVL